MDSPDRERRGAPGPVLGAARRRRQLRRRHVVRVPAASRRPRSSAVWSCTRSTRRRACCASTASSRPTLPTSSRCSRRWSRAGRSGMKIAAAGLPQRARGAGQAGLAPLLSGCGDPITSRSDRCPTESSTRSSTPAIPPASLQPLAVELHRRAHRRGLIDTAGRTLRRPRPSPMNAIVIEHFHGAAGDTGRRRTACRTARRGGTC